MIRPTVQSLRMSWMWPTSTLALAAVVLFGASCKSSEGRDLCSEDDQCKGATVCEFEECVCRTGVDGATCSTDYDCASANCMLPECRCELLETIPTETSDPTKDTGTVSIPPHTTDCELDDDGCILGGASACNVVLDILLDSAVTVHVGGTLLDDPAPSMITVVAYGETNGYEWTGYMCRVFEGGAELMDVNRMPLASHNWDPPVGEDPVSLDATFDRNSTSGTCTVTAAGAPNTPLQSDAMGMSGSDTMVVSVWNARICNISVSSPM